jgi:L-aspartate oxidase
VLADPQIDVAENERASCAWIADGRCVGLVTERRAIAARATILATGGMAALWEPSTNPLGTTGAGIAIAYKAGAALADIEFTQFHPTALAGSGFLLSEALRGEGALLLDAAGERFTDELAGRDVLARAIAAKGIAMLDLRPVNRTRFPTLMDALTERGHNPSEAPIEVAPAAHYTVGGIVTDLDGHSEIPGLYAVGECACTGAHGANRLASNSLLECLVFGRRAAAAAADEPELPMAMSRPPAACGAPVVSSPLRKQLWDDAGPVRDRAGLTRLAGSSHLLARLVAQSALTRVESRGAHFRTDFPHRRESLARHIVVRAGSSPVFEEWR